MNSFRNSANMHFQGPSNSTNKRLASSNPNPVIRPVLVRRNTDMGTPIRAPIHHVSNSNYQQTTTTNSNHQLNDDPPAPDRRKTTNFIQKITPISTHSRHSSGGRTPIVVKLTDRKIDSISPSIPVSQSKYSYERFSPVEYGQKKRVVHHHRARANQIRESESSSDEDGQVNLNNSYWFGNKYICILLYICMIVKSK